MTFVSPAKRLNRGNVGKPPLRDWFAALEPELARVGVGGAERLLLGYLLVSPARGW